LLADQAEQVLRHGSSSRHRIGDDSQPPIVYRWVMYSSARHATALVSCATLGWHVRTLAEPCWAAQLPPVALHAEVLRPAVQRNMEEGQARHTCLC
jgi:hypothetical protein